MKLEKEYIVPMFHSPTDFVAESSLIFVIRFACSEGETNKQKKTIENTQMVKRRVNCLFILTATFFMSTANALL